MSFRSARARGRTCMLLVALVAAGCASDPGASAGAAATPAPAPKPASPAPAPPAAPAAPTRTEAPAAEPERPAAAPLSLRDAQDRLAALGYKPGVADGKPGPRTREALKRFQHDQGLPQTGQLDAETMQRLRAASNKR